MQLRHKKLVQRSTAIGTAALLVSALAACSAPAQTEVTNMSLWIWPGGVSEPLLEEVVDEFPDYGVEVSVIGDDFRQKLVTTFTGGSGIPSITGVKGENMPYFLSEDSLFTDFNELGVEDLLADFPAWKLAEATTADGVSSASRSTSARPECSTAPTSSPRPVCRANPTRWPRQPRPGRTTSHSVPS